MKTFIKSGFWTSKKTGATPKGWLDLTKLIKDNSGGLQEITYHLQEQKKETLSMELLS